MSTDQEVKEEKVEDDDNVTVPGFLLNALNKIPFLPQPEQHGSGWQVEQVEAVLDDGSTKEMYFVVETRISGNEIHVYWYDLENLRAHAQTAMMALQNLTQLHQASSPLVVADKTQMNNVINEAKQTGLIHPGK
jgi:hypothetical protein